MRIKYKNISGTVGVREFIDIFYSKNVLIAKGNDSDDLISANDVSESTANEFIDNVLINGYIDTTDEILWEEY